jgi:hypothetical protein
MGKTPKEIRDETPVAVAARGNVAHLSTSESNNQSIGVLGEDVSRIQSASLDYSASSTYKIGDLVLEGDIVYRCTTAITVAEAFDDSKWQSISSTTHESQWKEPAVLSTTVDISLTGNQSIDGTMTVDGNRILVKDQNTLADNGIYIADSSTWSRSPDMDVVGEFESAVVAVEQGATNASTIWIQTEIVTTIGSNDVEFSIISFSGKLSDLNIDTEKDWDSNRITNLGDPTGAQDAATKSYVDAHEESATNWKEPVIRATTSTDGNITLSGVQSVDGDNTSDGQRILVKNQSASADNGIYIADSSTWIRTLDLDESSQFESAAVWVTVGDTQADTAWVQTLTVTTVNTDDVSFSKFASATGLSANVFSFSAVSDYTTGNLVIHNSTMIRANQDITAGTFNGNHWDPVINVHDHTNTQSYNIGDLVLDDEILYICKNNIGAGNAFSLNNFRIVNTSNLFVKATTGPNAVRDQEFLGYERDNNDSVPQSYLGRDISRAQSASILYETDSSYDVGDLVLQDDLTYRCITAISASGETFDIDKWIPVGGVGSKNVKHLFSASDFPDTINVGGTQMYPLESGVEYIVAKPITLSNPIVLDGGFDVELTSFAPFTNILTYSGSDAFFRIRTGSNTYSSVASGGVGLITFSTGTTAALTNGRTVNINSDSGEYTQTQATIISQVPATSFTIAGTFGSDDTGSWELLPRSLELHHIHVAGNSLAQTFDLDFTTSTTISLCTIDNCVLSGFEKDGEIREALDFRLENNEFIDKQGELILDNCETMRVINNVWKNVVTGDDNTHIDITGTILHGVVRDNSFETPDTDDNALEIVTLSTDSRILIEGNVDKNDSKTSLFLTTGSGLDETDPKLIVKNNVRQKNSSAFGFTKLPSAPDNTFPFTVSASDTPTDYATSGGWEFEHSERMEMQDDDIGQVKYIGEEDGIMKIDYGASFKSTTSAQELFIVIQKAVGVYLDGETVSLTGQTSGETDATGTATVDDDHVLTGVAVVSGGSAYTDAETLTIIGQTSGATNGEGTATVAVGVIQTIAVTLGGGFSEVVISRIYNSTRNVNDFRNITGTVTLPVSKNDIFIHQFGIFNGTGIITTISPYTNYTLL